MFSNSLKKNLKPVALVVWQLLSAIAAVAQHEVILNGSLLLKSGQKIPYRLEMHDSAGIIYGFSTTYKAPDDAKAIITVKLDRVKKRLVIKETELKYSNGFHPDALCMISATLEYNSLAKELKGTITSNEAANVKCASGAIVFNNEYELKALFAPPGEKKAALEDAMERATADVPDAKVTDKYDVTISMRKKDRRDTAPAPASKEDLPVPLTTDKVTAGIEKAYEWYSDTLVIELWDGGNIDGDRITVQLDDKALVNAHYLVKEKKQLRAALAPGMHTLAIQADNEGSDPPNTATLMLTDGKRQYSIVSYNPKGGISQLKIRKVTR